MNRASLLVLFLSIGCGAGAPDVGLADPAGSAGDTEPDSSPTVETIPHGFVDESGAALTVEANGGVAAIRVPAGALPVGTELRLKAPGLRSGRMIGELVELQMLMNDEVVTDPALLHVPAGVEVEQPKSRSLFADESFIVEPTLRVGYYHPIGVIEHLPQVNDNSASVSGIATELGLYGLIAEINTFDKQNFSARSVSGGPIGFRSSEELDFLYFESYEKLVDMKLNVASAMSATFTFTRLLPDIDLHLYVESGNNGTPGRTNADGEVSFTVSLEQGYPDIWLSY